jgi:hypothetical protein
VKDININFKSNAAKLSKLVENKNLISKDFICCLEGIKPVSRLNFNETKLNEFVDLCENLKLSYAISDFRIKTVNDKIIFSNLSRRIYEKKDLIGKSSRYIYISKDKELCEKARQYDAEENNIKLGELLGFPKCCTEFFDKNHNFGNPDIIRDITQNTDFEYENEATPFYINYVARYFGYSIISHFPCSWKCQASISLAKKYLECISEYFPEQGKEFVGMLKKPVLYSDEKVILFRNEKIIPDDKQSFALRLSKEDFLSNTNEEFNKIIYKDRISRVYMNNRYKYSIRNPLLLRFK